MTCCFRISFADPSLGICGFIWTQFFYVFNISFVVVHFQWLFLQSTLVNIKKQFIPTIFNTNLDTKFLFPWDVDFTFLYF